VVLSVALALLVPPTGQDFYLRAFVLFQAIAGAAVIIVIPLLLVRRGLPARERPPAHSVPMPAP
jgi:hypothetical protein